MTWGRGRGFGLDAGVGEAGVMSVIYSVLAADQCCHFASTIALNPLTLSPHIQDEARLVAHPVRRPSRLPDQIDVDHADAGNAGARVLHHGRQLSRGRTVRRRQGHYDVDGAVVLDVDLIDQAEFIDVSRNFGIEHRLQRRHDFTAKPFGLIRRQRRMRFHVAGFDFGTLCFDGVGHENNSRALISACARWSTSSRVLYIPNEARQVAVTLNRSKSGITQWVPARTAMPCRPITVAPSWAWAPFISNEITGPLSRAAPIRRSELISRRRSWA